jgi:ABC-2 type transport system ATP-binding protein
MNTLLQANNLGLRGRGYNNWLFKDVNLKINRGDIAIIYGNCGSGKTLLADILCGLKKPSHGFVERSAHLAVATQEFTLYKDLTVQENLDFISAIHDNPSVDQAEIINLTGLTGWEKTMAKQLPVGQRKMLQIACAIIQKTPGVIFDEPTCGLDQQLNVRFHKIVEILAKEERGILIMTNQMLKVAAPTQVFNLTDRGLITISQTNSIKETGYNYASEGVG